MCADDKMGVVPTKASAICFKPNAIVNAQCERAQGKRSLAFCTKHVFPEIDTFARETNERSKTTNSNTVKELSKHIHYTYKTSKIYVVLSSFTDKNNLEMETKKTNGSEVIHSENTIWLSFKT